MQVYCSLITIQIMIIVIITIIIISFELYQKTCQIDDEKLKKKKNHINLDFIINSHSVAEISVYMWIRGTSFSLFHVKNTIHSVDFIIFHNLG